MLKVVYAGNPECSAKTLRALTYAGQRSGAFEIVGVLTNLPSKKGRDKTITDTPVGKVAKELGLKLFTVNELDSSLNDSIKELKPNVLVSFAYGQIFKKPFLDLFQECINIHPSALPKYRGCTPVQAAILNRDKSTAVSIQEISEGLDEGNILSGESIPLNLTETADYLLDVASEIGARHVMGLLEEWDLTGVVRPGAKQIGEVSYTKKIYSNECAKIDWTKDDSKTIDAKVRAYNSEPGAWCKDGDTTIKILGASFIDDKSVENLLDEHKDTKPGEVILYDKRYGIVVRTVDGVILLTELQKQGKKAMDYKSFMNGARNFIGMILS